jgi:ribosome biogenesis GTPase
MPLPPDENLHDQLQQRFEGNRRSFKQERKIAAATDQSGQKKSDRDQTHNHLAALVGAGIRGRVISIEARAIQVEIEKNGQMVECQLRGQLKQIRSEEKNLVAAGDWVWVDEPDSPTPRIQAIEPRKTILSRADNHTGRKQQIIATNNDYVCIVLSVGQPSFRPHLADRYLVSTLWQGMIPIIIINKYDLVYDKDTSQEECALVKEFIQSYRKANFIVIPLSTYTQEGMDELTQLLKDKTCVFSGQSGVGKSSIINAIAQSKQRIGGLTAKTNKGSHTTTAPKLIPLPTGGWCIDTPGIGSFGLWLITTEMIRMAFPDVMELGKRCHYPDCSHTHEDHCAVKEAIDNGEFSQLRLNGYSALLKEITHSTRHRLRR